MESIFMSTQLWAEKISSLRLWVSKLDFLKSFKIIKRFSVYTVAIAIIIAIICIHSSIQELRSTTSSQILILFLVSLLITDIFMPFIVRNWFKTMQIINEIMLFIGLGLLFPSLSLFGIDIWLTFKWSPDFWLKCADTFNFFDYRNFYDPLEETGRFKKYCVYVMTFCSVLALFCINRLLDLIGTLSFAVTAIILASYIVSTIIHALGLIATGVKVFQISSKQNLSNHNKFEKEKQRYLFIQKYKFKCDI